MSGSNTYGYDVALEIELEHFLTHSLQDLFLRGLLERLTGGGGSVPFELALPAPTGLIGAIAQSGALRLSGEVDESIRLSIERDETVTQAFVVRLEFPNADALLEEVPEQVPTTVTIGSTEIELPGNPGLDGLPPTALGGAAVELRLTIAVADRPGNQVRIGIDLDGDDAVAVELTVPDSILLPLPLLPDPPDEAIRQAARRAELAEQARAAVVEVVRGALPVGLDVTLGAPVLCDFSPRAIAVALVRSGAHARVEVTPACPLPASLLLLVKILPGALPDDLSRAQRHRRARDPAELRVDNKLLAEIVCCLVKRSLSFLVDARETVLPLGCMWRIDSRFSLAGVTVHRGWIQLTLEDGRFLLTGALTQVEYVGEMESALKVAHISVPITLFDDDGDFALRLGDIEVDAQYNLTPEMAILLAIAMGPLGALAGIGLAEAFGNLVADALEAPIRGALDLVSLDGPALPLLPLDVQRLFGDLRLTGEPVLDDLVLRCIPVARQEAAARGLRFVGPGAGFDLDAQAVIPASRARRDGDPDLLWEPDRQGLVLRSPGAARKIAVHGRTFATLDEARVRALPFDQDPNLPVAARYVGLGGSVRPRGHLLLGCRTSEGRHAKVAVWRTSDDMLCVEYVLWPSPAMVQVARRVSERSRRYAGSAGSGFAMWDTFEVAHRLECTASAPRLGPALTWSWSYEGHAVSGASGALPGTRATYEVSGARLVILTAEGEDLPGEVCATVTDAWGFQASRCLRAGVEGRLRLPSDQQDEGDGPQRIETPPELERIPVEELPRISLEDALFAGLARGVGLKLKDLDFLRRD